MSVPDQVIALFEKGHRISVIAKRLDVSTSLVRRYLVDRGLVATERCGKCSRDIKGHRRCKKCTIMIHTEYDTCETCGMSKKAYIALIMGRER